MKGEHTLQILKLLEDGPLDGTQLIRKFFPVGYEPSFQVLARERGRAAAAKAIRLRYRNFLYKLERSNLVAARPLEGSIIFSISDAGRKKLTILKNRRGLPPVKTYKKEKGAGPILVTFDIPERRRAERDWLRRVLRHLEFTLVDRGVWIGGNRLPLNLLADLNSRQLSKNFHSFRILKSGVLKGKR